MKIGIWNINIDSKSLAKIQWTMYNLFKYKPQNPCGHTKHSHGYYCHQPTDKKHCKVINKGKTHMVVCKCCGRVHIDSNSYIYPENVDEWFSF